MKKQDTLENQANYAYLALGSNLGSKINNLEYAKYKLSKIGVKLLNPQVIIILNHGLIKTFLIL